MKPKRPYELRNETGSPSMRLGRFATLAEARAEARNCGIAPELWQWKNGNHCGDSCIEYTSREGYAIHRVD